MGEPQNRIYEGRFLSRLKDRIRKRSNSSSTDSSISALKAIRTVYEFDDQITARFFGFGSADNYYATQSSKRFLHSIEVPTLIVQAKDDPLIPFEIFSDPVIASNPHLEFLAVDHGGHLGFIANRAPRFWVDRVLLQWILESRNKVRPNLVGSINGQ
jgi:predicted alpha/beta-fold hydrolase